MASFLVPLPPLSFNTQPSAKEYAYQKHLHSALARLDRLQKNTGKRNLPLDGNRDIQEQRMIDLHFERLIKFKAELAMRLMYEFN